MRRLLSLVMIFMSLTLTGCTKEILAPVVEEKIELPPFEWLSFEIQVGNFHSQSMNFYAPAGRAPQLDYKVKEVSGNPDMTIRLYAYPAMDEPCSPNCERVTWRLYVDFAAKNPGEALISVYDQSNPSRTSTFSVTAVPALGKG